jgi:outer membrane protein TolC
MRHKIFKKVLLLFLFISTYFNIVYSQSLEDYLIIASENNTELKSYFHEYMAAMERVPQVGTLPDPTASFGYFVRPMAFPMGNQRSEISLMQMFPWFGMLKTQKGEANQMALMKYEAFRDAKNRLYFEVKNTWFELYRLEGEKQAIEKNLEIMKSMERLSIIRYQGGNSGSGGTSAGKGMSSGSTSSGSGASSSGGGMSGMGGNNAAKSPSPNQKSSSSSMNSRGMGGEKTSMADVIRIQMELKEMENELEEIYERRKPLVKRFNQLLNRSLNQELNTPEFLEEQIIDEEYFSQIDSLVSHNPMVAMIENEKEAYLLKEKMARKEGMPMIGAGLNYMVFSPLTMENGMRSGGDNMIMPMVTVTLPIYRKKYKAMENEAKYLQQSAQHKLENTTSQIQVSLEESKTIYKNSSRKLKLYKGQTELAEQALRILTTAYANEEASFEEVLRIQQQLLDYHLRYINAVVDQNNASAMIEMLTASRL